MKRYFKKMILILAMCLMFLPITSLAAATTGDMAQFPGVSLSPDGSKRAWTTDLWDKTNERLPKDYTVDMNVKSSVADLRTGQHYYKKEATGSVPIGKWVVSHTPGQCIHDTPTKDTFAGFTYRNEKCMSYYNNGWLAYCADCGEEIDFMFIYAKESTVRRITSVPASSVYVYLCPHCTHLEQGHSYQHRCIAISSNKYRVTYRPNDPNDSSVEGYMAPTMHVYDNSATYNGKPVADIGYTDTALRKNSFACKGYVFAGWNTKADGSGTSYTDGQEVMNLTAEEDGIVKLYAQWKKAESSLLVDANGGTYNGQAVYEQKQKHGTTYHVDNKLLVPPAGYKVTFQTNGGATVNPITTTKSFDSWEMQPGFSGQFKDDIYHFSGANGTRDRLKALYSNNGFVLPVCTRNNASLVGWYENASLSDASFVGKPGDKIIVDKDTVLYAKWATLTLWAYDDYDSHGGVGAVDLKWEQKDGKSKYYLLYQSEDKLAWKQISESSDVGNVSSVNKSYGYSGRNETYIVPYSGLYTLTAYGAQGGSYGSNSGGKGGMVTGKVWLEAGEIITYTIGGQNGYNGGGSASQYGNGGGSTNIVSNRQGTLLIAGGGGGASSNGNGGAGGSAVNLRTDNVASGASGQAGGGAGHVGGKAGEYITHSCTDSCYTTYNKTTSAGSSFYAAYTPGMTNGWGGTPRLSGGSIFYGGHSAADGFSLSLQAGNRSTYFSTPGTGTLTFNVNNFDWGTDCTWGGLGHMTVEVYNQAGTRLLSRNTNSLANSLTTSVETVCMESGCPYHRITKYHYTYTDTYVKGTKWYKPAYSWQDHDDRWRGVTQYDSISLNVTLPIDASTTGIYVVVKYQTTELDGNSGAASAVTISNVKYSYSHREKVCGYYDGQVISSTPAYGGSNYVNTGAVSGHTTSAGNRSGNGAFVITSASVGFLDELFLNDVLAKDKAAPGVIISYTESLVGEDVCRIRVAEPKDYGTLYYHRAESYEAGAATKLVDSNVTENTLISGVNGYRYYVDGNAAGTVTGSHTLTKTGSVEVSMQTTVRYLHIAAVDVAGNIGPTKNIPIPKKDDPDIEVDEEYTEDVPLKTRQMTLEDTDHVYGIGNKTFYVKADGNTEHVITFSGYVDGKATSDYQVDCLQMVSLSGTSSEWYQTRIPRVDIAAGNEEFTNMHLKTNASTEELTLLRPTSATATRTERAVNAALAQRFVLETSSDGKQINVYPRAFAELEDKQISSNETEDKRNGLTLIPDGKPPVITGIEALENAGNIDMTEESKDFVIRATDDGSGIKTLVVTVLNLDNMMKRTYSSDTGVLTITMIKEDFLFLGDFVVTAQAYDNVGNVGIHESDTLAFTLKAELTRARFPHNGDFKAGDGAVLTITTGGYADKVIIRFPDELLALNPGLDKEYIYEFPEAIKTEIYEFNIPLGTPNGNYTIQVEAWKKGKKLTEDLQLPVRTIGSIIEEFRTRIRDNGV